MKILENCENISEFDTGDYLLTDAYFYARKYMIIEILDVSPFDDIKSFAKNYPFDNVADFYKYRLKCFEEVRKDQPIIKALQVPGFSQPARLKAIYSEKIAKQVEIDFPPLRTHKKLQPVFLLPQFCFRYPIPRSVVCNEIIHLPLVCRQMVAHLLANLRFRNML